MVRGSRNLFAGKCGEVWDDVVAGVMYNSVDKVKPLEDYKLELTFDNGEVKLFDVKPFMDKGIFRELYDIELFKTVKKSFDTVEWKNEADIDPEVLYENSIKMK